MISSFAHPSNLIVEDTGDKLTIYLNLANAGQVSSNTTKLSFTAYYNDDGTVDQEFVSQTAIKDYVFNNQNECRFITSYRPKCRPANITLMVLESLVDGSENELGQCTVTAICYPDAPTVSIESNGFSKVDDVESHKVKTSGIKLRVAFKKDGGFPLKSVNFFVNKKDDSNSPIMKLPPIPISDEDVSAGFAIVSLPDVVTLADKMISINASVDNVANLESNVSSVSAIVSNAIRPQMAKMTAAVSCQNSAVPVSGTVSVKDGVYVSVLARTGDDCEWCTTNLINMPVHNASIFDSNCAFNEVVCCVGESCAELLPFVTYQFAAVQHIMLKNPSDCVSVVTKLMPDQSKLSNVVSATPFADFSFVSELNLSACGALSLHSGVLSIMPALSVSHARSDENFCSVWKLTQNGLVVQVFDSCEDYSPPPAFQLHAFEYTDSLQLCVDFYKVIPDEVANVVTSNAILDMDKVNGRPFKCLHVSHAALAFRPPPSADAIPVPAAVKLELYNKALFVHHADPEIEMKSKQLVIKSIEYQVSNDVEFGEDSLQFLSDDKKKSIVVLANDNGVLEKSQLLLLYLGENSSANHVKSLASENSFYVRARYTVSFFNNIVLQSNWNQPAHSGLVNKCIKVNSITLKQTPPRDANNLTSTFLSLIVEASVDVGQQMVQDVSVFVLVKYGANSHKADMTYDAVSNVWRSDILSPTPKVDYSSQPIHVVAVGPLNMDIKTL